MEEDSYTKEETKSNKFVNLVHAASLNQASAVANGQPHATTLAELNAAFSGIDAAQGLAEGGPLSSLDEENGDEANWPALNSNVWNVKPAPSLPVQVRRCIKEHNPEGEEDSLTAILQQPKCGPQNHRLCARMGICVF
jgi:hypothetical protein